MANILKKWIESDRRELRRINKIANKVESYAKQMSELTDEQLQAKRDGIEDSFQGMVFMYVVVAIVVVIVGMLAAL